MSAKTQECLLSLIDHINEEYPQYPEFRAMLIDSPGGVSLAMFQQLAKTAIKLIDKDAKPGLKRLEQGLETGLMLGYFAARNPSGFEEMMVEFKQFKCRQRGENVVGIGMHT